MTPKEKALEIYRHYLQRYEKTDSCFGLCNDHDICDGTGHGCDIWKAYAKDSAIYAVDLIIEAVEAFNYTGTMYDDFETNNIAHTEDKLPAKYWQEVKKEIENMSIRVK